MTRDGDMYRINGDGEVIDYLVEAGPIDAPQLVTGPDGEALRLEPSANKRFVRVWRG